MSNNIVFFDFDGTITNSDSLSKFFRYYKNGTKYYRVKYYTSFYDSLKFYFNEIDVSKYKEIIIREMFRGQCFNSIKKDASIFFKKVLINDIRPAAKKTIIDHQNKLDKIVIVSASLDIFLNDFCKENSIDLISNKLEVVDGICTGQLIGKDCNGEEKVNRVMNNYNLKNYDQIYAYGDTENDKPLLAIADFSYFKPFRQD